MMNRLTLLLLTVFFSVHIESRAQQAGNASFCDSLKYFLDHFQANTGSIHFKQTIKKALKLSATNKLTDSLAGELIAIENFILRSNADSFIINRHPFDQDTTLDFGNLLVGLFESLHPRKENLYYAAALNNLGVLYNRKWQQKTAGDDAKALELIEKALIIRKKVLGEEHPAYAESLFRISEVYAKRGENEKALSIMLHAFAIREKIKSAPDAFYTDNLFLLAEVCKGLKKYDTAMLLYEQEISIRKKIEGEGAYYALRLYYTGDLVMYLWQYQKAFVYFTQALDITRRTLGSENLQYAYCVEGIAGYYYAIAEYEKAVPLYLESLGIKERLYGKEYFDIPLTLHNLAATYFKMARYEQAIPCFRRTLAICKKSPLTLPENYAYELSWLALLYQKIGNYDKALSFYKQALDIPGYKQQGLRYAVTLSNMADVYAHSNESRQALSCLDQAKQITKNIKGEQSPEYAGILYSVAAFYEKLNRYETAMQLCRQTLAIRKTILGEAHPQYASSLCQLGSVYMNMKKMDSANSCFTQALEIQKEILGEEHPDYIKTLNYLALSQISTNNTAAALTMVKANRLELKYIARTYTSLSEQEKMELEKDQYIQFSYLPSFVYENNIDNPEVLQQLYINELVLKSMVLNDQQSLLHSIRKSGDTAVIGLYNEWRVNKVLIGKQLLKPIGERLYNLDSIIETTNQMEQELSRISVSFRQQHEAPSLTNISARLLQGEAAVEFIKFRVYNRKWTDSVMYGALVLRAGSGAPAFVPLFEEKQLLNVLSKAGKNENAVNRFYSQALDNGKDSSGNALYRLTWMPLEKYLPGVHTIYYAPAGLLHRIAFKALPVDPSHCLIDKYSLDQMLSTRAVALPETLVRKPSAINVWGDINYNLQKDDTDNHLYTTVQRGLEEDWYENTDDADRYDTAALQSFKWPSLYGARVEMDSIKSLFVNAGMNVTVTTDSLATEEMFKKLDGNSPQLLHIATHGFFWGTKDRFNSRFTLQQDPMFRSGLVLAGGNEIWDTQKRAGGKDDGILTSYEIANLDLGNTDLIVLSACETALGDLQGNEGVIGLQRAFKTAGVKQMILSLWKVPDKETVELMTVFYKHLIEGRSPAESLRAAQLKMKETYYAPYYWAAFVLIE
ncbi:MAG TPA: CHAT domain-containing tetratricopeptide repeat protein [Parafilimonas sp.]|nr:CHAT domain-containing tetratricopeptide repeat protein [Parafilimonas sp.]